MASEWDVVSEGKYSDIAKKLLSTARDITYTPLGMGENVLQMATGAVAAPIAGLSGMVAGTFAPTGKGLDTAADTVRKVQEGLTYSPRTKMGRALEQYNPLQLIPKAGQFVGEKTLDVTGSPEAATIADVAVQALPAVLFRKSANSLEPTPQAVELANQLKKQQAVQNAVKFVEQKTGMQWKELPDEFKAQLTEIANDATNLEKLDPAALARQVRMTRLGIPATRGQVTRNVPQLTSEENLSRAKAGGPIRDIYATQDTRLHDLLSKMKDTGVPSTSLGVGEAVQKTARGIEKQSRDNYESLYKTARETEPDAVVSAMPVVDLLKGNPEMQRLGWLESYLNRAKIKETGENARSDVPLKELYDLRIKANGIRKAGGTDSFYAGEVIKAVDESMNQIPESAKKWRKATNAFKQHKITFEDQGGIERLVSDASRTDPKIALEDTFDKTVRSGSAAQLQQVKKLFADNGESGTQAWNALRSSTIDYLKNKAAGEMQVVGEQGQLQFNGVFLKALRELDADGKLDVLFSKEDAAKLREIGEAVRDIRTKPDARVHGSSTASNTVRFLEQFSGKLSKVPVVGDVAGGVIKVGQKLHELGKEARLVKEASTTPIQEATKAAQSKRASSARAQMTAELLKKYGYPAILASSEDRSSKLAKRLQEMMANDQQQQ